MLSQTQRLTLYMDRSTDRVRNSVERFLKLSVSLYMDRSTDRVWNSVERFLKLSVSLSIWIVRQIAFETQ
ncbi:hypothetical protein LEP1GSC151_1432 [Leptospira interrogans serovar Grippotyphosa str. LT2186]|uniref:Uncharacterized protein n=1 Tax=Leptospira interrogans serovar Grippotyphosa str. LT2186 TaxID=1001599 RepID=M3HD38_LEPIR|nr:hypothetical protein [Leptospira interrogans]EKR45102.1 hypothetical protein LEP1GSC097_3174 [Leptospira interrogans serovar Grippotyphosa str. UI 08368]EMG10595.1 hypothetical protein LEP1GSC151_1432 [Leptospira interrogans serovar Grippotyphosa str. LT2186]EMN87742.1 hypothetical protein LEP1GSC107_2780 [Leptospira interrogans serovar Grippotyphosa str. UI 12769]